MKKEYITPQTLVIRTETMAPIATSDDFTVNIENGGSDYDGEFYSKPNNLWGDDEEFYNKSNSLWADDEK